MRANHGSLTVWFDEITIREGWTKPPDYSHLPHRAAGLTVKIPRRPGKGPVYVVVDSTGLKIFGEGEWKARQHGVGKRRTWRKVHLAVDEDSKDIIGIEVTMALLFKLLARHFDSEMS